jgi:hypothetical protein
LNFANIELTEPGNPLRISRLAHSEARAKIPETRYEVVGLRTAKLVQRRHKVSSARILESRGSLYQSTLLYPSILVMQDSGITQKLIPSKGGTISHKLAKEQTIGKHLLITRMDTDYMIKTRKKY